ncbi:hypothetical protein MMC28_004623 [Mycoblastus sanguinarius]|nr:hypothetical protein [Mycoblastus sanguinarius]
MLPTSDVSSKINLLDLLPGDGPDGGNKYALKEFTLETCPAYDVLEYLTLQDDDEGSSIRLNGETIALETILGHALSHWAKQRAAGKLWVQTLCLDPLHGMSAKQLSQLQKRVCTNAEVVTIWIGRDHEDDDILTEYLGSGCESSTKSAFDICQSIANIEDPQEDLRPLLLIKAEHSQRAMRCHLANLLYRPWFRELPLLKTNYLDEIPVLRVGCGTKFIDWASIKVAAERLRMIEPIPHLLEENFMEIFTSKSHIEAWLDARQNFGFSIFHLVPQAVWLSKRTHEPQSRNDARIDNVTAFSGIISGICGWDSKMHEIPWQSIQAMWDQEDRRLHCPITLASLQIPNSLPTLPIQRALIPPPDPEYRAPYVHAPAKPGAFNILKLFPQKSDPDAPIQGSIVSTSGEDAPPFLYVCNATLKDYRRNTFILVDGQSFLVPEALDIFLRRIRHTEDEKLLFIWKICWYPDEADVPGDRRGVSALTNYMKNAEIFLSLSVDFIDMYDVLFEAAEEIARKREGSSDEYDWLLDLLDEAQVNDLPATAQSREEEKQRANMRSRAHLFKSAQRGNGADADSSGSEEEWMDTSGSEVKTDPEDEADEALGAAAEQDSPHPSLEKLSMDDTKVMYFY